MAPCVIENVSQRVPNLVRCAKNAIVVTIRKHPARSTQKAVERLGNPDEEALKATHERLSVVRLAQHVDVIRLHRHLDHAKRRTISPRRDRIANHAITVTTSKRGKRNNSRRDVNRITRCQPRAGEVGNAGIFLPRTTGTSSSTTVSV